jgi:cold-inducible RNA-binding protein
VKNIFVGNLDFGTTEDALRALFEGHGAVERVSMVRDRDTGQPRGFAFVEMTDAGEAERAIASLNGQTLGGRPINVNEARPRPERGHSPAGGHGPGGGGPGGFRGSRGGGGGGRGQRREPRW